jgi:carboxymethylenebutenolidase
MSENQELVTAQVKAGEYEAYLARPANGENLPGVIIIHEIFGLNENIRDIARRFARENYVALAVDLYSLGRNRQLCIFKTTVDMMTNILKSSHMDKLDDAFRFLQKQPQVNGQRIGIIGFCMGGGYSLAFAVHNEELKAASIFYGANPKPLNSVARACAIVGNYGEKDRFFVGQARKLEEALTHYQRPHDIKIYPNAGHSFFNDTMKTYAPEAAADSWQRTLKFFSEHLPA